jgi:hypothetical protein
MWEFGNGGFPDFTRLLKIISKRRDGNAGIRERPPFPHFQGYFRRREKLSGEWTSRPTGHPLERGLWRSLYLVGPDLSLDTAPPQHPQKAFRAECAEAVVTAA